MIRLRAADAEPTTIEDAYSMLQTGIELEFATLPVYLYALYSVNPGTNAAARALVYSVVLEEMIHFCLACNILNALGGDPQVVAPIYPGPLPGDIGHDGTLLTAHLLPFSQAAMQQGMAIEEPESPIRPPIARTLAASKVETVTIGQWYERLDAFLATLPASSWAPSRHQIVDDQFFGGLLFPIAGYADAHRAIQDIVSEGEGAKDNPLDFQDQLAHYYRFGQVFNDRVLTKATAPPGYTWGPERLGVDWTAVAPAIADPASHDFSHDSPAAQQAQADCNRYFTAMIDALQLAVTGQGTGALGQAVRAMFDLRMAALHAFTVPLADGTHVAGPAFLYRPEVRPEMRPAMQPEVRP